MHHVLDEMKTAVLTPDRAKVLIDDYISQVLAEKTTLAADIHPHYQRLWQAITNLYSAGGKRLRPYMTLLVYEAYSREPVQAIIPAAAAQELLHQAVLIHDDIIDRDSIRYSVKNISAQYEDMYTPYLSDKVERRHFADSGAILAGDLLISEAHTQLASLTIDKTILLAVQQLLSQAIFQVAGGELLDTELSFVPPGSIDPLTIAEYKTASYSFITPLMIGAVLAGAPPQQQSAITAIGQLVGIAYQLRDDLIGVFGAEAVSGKSVESDIREGKQTMLVGEFYKRATQTQKKQFETVFRNPMATERHIADARSLLEQSGAKNAVEKTIEKFTRQTIQQLDGLAIDAAHRTMLANLIKASLERDY